MTSLPETNIQVFAPENRRTPKRSFFSSSMKAMGSWAKMLVSGRVYDVP